MKASGSSVEVHTAGSGAVEAASAGVSAQDWQSETAYDDLVDEVSSGVMATIQRASIYTGTNGDNCNTYGSGYGEHRYAGGSIEYYDDINNLAETVIGASIGGLAGLLAGSFTTVGAIVTTVLGGLVGAIAGYAVGHLKDTNILSFGAIDWDVCSWGYCQPAIMAFASGTWHTTDANSMYQVGIDPGNHVQAPNLY